MSEEIEMLKGAVLQLSANVQANGVLLEGLRSRVSHLKAATNRLVEACRLAAAYIEPRVAAGDRAGRETLAVLTATIHLAGGAE